MKANTKITNKTRGNFPLTQTHQHSHTQNRTKPNTFHRHAQMAKIVRKKWLKFSHLLFRYSVCCFLKPMIIVSYIIIILFTSSGRWEFLHLFHSLIAGPWLNVLSECPLRSETSRCVSNVAGAAVSAGVRHNWPNGDVKMGTTIWYQVP